MNDVESDTPITSVGREQRFFEHIPALDGLRGIAIILVLVHNSEHFGAHPSGVIWIAALIGAIGWIGVQLFFVLSGFLITTKLLTTQSSLNYYSVFFGRRVLRIFPLYYAALIVGLVIVPAVTHHIPDSATSASQETWLWLFLFNWAHPLGTPAYGFPHFWSLAVEEQFYLIWPFVVHRLNPTQVSRVCFAVIGAALAIRGLMALSGATDEMIYEFTICRMDALAVGALVAAWLQCPESSFRLKKTGPWVLPAAFAIFTAGALFTHLYTRGMFSTQTLGYTFLEAFFALILLAPLTDSSKMNRVWRRFLSLRALRSIGKYSFAIYVFHFPIQWHLEKSLPRFDQAFATWSGIFFALAVGISSYGAAFASYHLFEKHFLRLKVWFSPKHSPRHPQTELLEHA